MFNRYFIGFIATIGLIIILILLIFSGGGKPKVPTTSKTLDSYATTDAEASLLIDGPINADQDHQQIKITISSDNATFEHITGYQGSVVTQQNYASNVDSYTNFLFALEHAGFTLGNKSSAVKDERGYCPQGDRYILELNQDGQNLERFWATSCGNPKSYGGNLALTLSLFQAQIPDYDTLIQNVQL